MKDIKPALYIVATPIGNLEDITLRALRILAEVDTVFAEDTRLTGKLLAHFKIKNKLQRYDSYSTDKNFNLIVTKLKEGKSIALVTDAGTPAISDPGSKLVRDLYNTFGDEINVIPIPGPSALTAALSVAGITDGGFTFLGFPPQKKGRKTFFEELAKETRPVIFYESPHRFLKATQSLKEVLSLEKNVVILRELTKIHEEIVRGTIEKIIEHYTNHPDRVRGEFVVIVG